MEFYVDNNEKSKTKLSVVIFIILTCLLYTGIIALIASNVFPSKFYHISNNTDKQIFYIIMFVILLPIVETLLCKFYINQNNAKIKVSPNYQYIYSYISIFPAIILTYITGIFILNMSVNIPRLIVGMVFVMVIIYPYILLNIIGNL